MPTAALHASAFAAAASYAASFWACMTDHFIYCPLLHWKRMTFAAAASRAAMFGHVWYAFLYNIPAAALLAIAFSSCG